MCSLVAQMVKASAYNARDLGLILGSGRSPGEGNCNPLQCSYWNNPMDSGACQATVYEVTRVRHDLVAKPPPTILESEVCVLLASGLQSFPSAI